ncbi:trehalase family glycosidase [Aureitalea marina]|uniref:Trehalase n=1 Tax=Aureitalea marina TaxID=930804 RepID=A0A2S7KMV2_9FLAO|nr:trehalase family glycosidase [Aureitalea marina]PQB03932.1 trehalase [Aureitalea marina]
MRLQIEDTLARLLQQEDTDGDKKITVEDQGPRKFVVRSTSGNERTLEGTYHLSNLLQELVIARNRGQVEMDLDWNRIDEPPADRINRMIRDYYWPGLTRTMDESGLGNLILDTKNDSLVSDRLRVYVPFEDEKALNYYKGLTDRFPIDVIQLPQEISPEYVRSINSEPGILSLALVESEEEISGVPFVVPGGRFNEMYGWDSYFESIGLNLDGRVDLTRAMADNFQYQIEHYGKILNANRSYYLTRTQPPFYSSQIKEVYEQTKDKSWLRNHLITAIKEYETVWMIPGKRLTDIGLNRFLAEGLGITPEAEEGHYDVVLRPYAKGAGMNLETFIQAYSSGALVNPQLDRYFVHDRTVRESGHDTSYRIEGRCADLVLVELNAMLYKYEMDFAELIKEVFDESFLCNGRNYNSSYWEEKAAKRKELVDQFLWNEDEGMYLDYDLDQGKQVPFVSATSLVPLWCGMAGEEQAQALIRSVLPKLKEKGGVASCDAGSRGDISADRPQRQWDYPNGWAPHQMMIWQGLFRYGYKKEAREIIYRWLFMITRNAVDYNGTIPEKYDVVAATHKVFAEYGNVGTEFEYITQEGFGWMNASFQLGYHLLDEIDRENLNQLIAPEELF